MEWRETIWYRRAWSIVGMAALSLLLLLKFHGQYAQAAQNVWMFCLLYLLIVLVMFFPRRPVVYIERTDAIVAIAFGSEYRFELGQRERAMEAGLGDDGHGIVAPRHTAYFADDEKSVKELGRFCTGSRDDCAKILAGCKVIPVSNLIPPVSEILPRKPALSHRGCVPIRSPRQFYRFIHGRNASEGMFWGHRSAE